MRLGRRSPERALAEAYAAAQGCPPPEVFLEAAWDALGADERGRLERHVEDCPACAAERELAREFDGTAAAAAPDPDVDWVVAELDRARSTPAHPRRRVVDWRWVSAAAVVLVAAGGYLALREAPPPLARPAEGAPVLRGAGIALLGPLGDTDAPPLELRFAEVAGAVRYDVQILEVDDAVLWETTVDRPPAFVPDSVRERLGEAVAYRWQVRAQGADGEYLAASGPAFFRVLPGAAATGGSTQ